MRDDRETTLLRPRIGRRHFFCDVLQRELFAEASPDRGRFRTFLLACFKNFQRNENRNDAAEKRGGKVKTFAIDPDAGESRYRQ
jgi:RNA polymerase sigma-70 factor (ECF subfamily)